LWEDVEEGAMMVSDKLFTGKWKNVEERIYQNKKALRYNRIFVPDNPTYRNNYFFAQLVNGLHFMVAPDWDTPHKKLYAVSFDYKNWIYFDINKLPTNCLSCELEEIGRLVRLKVIDSSIRYGFPLLKITGGIVALATVVHSGGQSITAYKAMTLGLITLSATWAVVGGSIQLLLEFSGDSELAKRFPTGFIEGTVGIICLSLIEDEITKKRVNAVINIIEGGVTLKFESLTDLETISNAITILQLVKPTGEIIETVPNEENN